MKRFIKHMAIPALCCIMTLTLFRVFFLLVKRVAAVAGEAAWTWKGPETVPCGMLYLLGDNIDASIDSRLWVDPFVPVKNVIARYYE